MKIEGEFPYNNDKNTLVQNGTIDFSHGELEIGIVGSDTMEIELDMFRGEDIVALAASIHQFGLSKIRHEEANPGNSIIIRTQSSYSV